MKVNISSLKKQHGSVEIKEEISLSKEDIPEAVEVLSPLKVDLEVIKGDNEYLVQGELQVKLKFKCMRCLEFFITDVHSDIFEEFIPEGDSSDNNNKVISDEKPTFQGEYIDLTELINESLILATPMKLVCSNECQGICPKCGENLNDNKCSCEVNDIDPRLAALADLFKE